MTAKSEFNADEWSQVLEGPPLAGLIVLSAQKGGSLRESIQMGKAYTEAREQHGGPELLDAILASAPEVDPAGYDSVEDLRGRGLQRLRDAVALLEQKAEPAEVDAYRSFVLDLAQRVAAAHKSGGVLGIGGERVSDAERAAIAALAAALGTDPPT